MRALWSAASGMKSQQTNIDVIAHNLANVNTAGFKKSRVEFQSLNYQNLREAAPNNPSGLQVGLGVRAATNQRIFLPGSLMETGNNLDVAISGAGFFEVLLPDGSSAFSRDGSFKIDANGNLVTTDGYFLVPDITLPERATDVQIANDGTVTYSLHGEQQQAGQITLVNVLNPAGMQAIGRNLYSYNEAAGPLERGLIPGVEAGSLVGGYLEQSNVQIVEEMVSMITAQRAYEINSRAIQASDEMLATANQLRR